MKKKFVAIISFILSLITAISVSGCNLVTTDKQRDNNQVVATVSISKDAPKEKIFKNELTIAYMNYGYYYVYTGSYTQAEIYDVIVDNLVNSKITLQYAMSEMDSDVSYAPKNDGYGKWDIERYLTLEDEGTKGNSDFTLSEYNSAKYDTILLINNLIESYEVEDNPLLSDITTSKVRTVPTNASNSTKVSDSEKADVISEGIIKGEIGSKRLEAYNKLVKELEKAGLLGEGFSGTDLSTSDYYKDNLKISLEEALIEKYEGAIQKKARETVTFNDLKEKYAEMYSAQTGKFESESEFSSAINSAYAQSPIVYSPYSGYGYVYNLLLGADDIQLAMIQNLKGNTQEKREARRQILASTTAKDLRGSWITSGYDFNYVETHKTGTFTGLYTFAKNSVNSLKYQGTVELLKEKTDKESAEYRVTPNVYDLDEFVEMMDTYLFGAVQTNDADVNTNASWYRKVTLPANSAQEYDAKISELLFAYSTDPGSLNTYKGYVISPKPSESGSESYKIEFAEAGRKLLTMGGNSYMIVATDYGYHVMFYSQVLDASVNYPTLIDYLNATNGIDETESYWQAVYNDVISNWDDIENSNDYLYLLQNIYSSNIANNAIMEKKASIINEYRYNTDYVVIYEDRFNDLKK